MVDVFEQRETDHVFGFTYVTLQGHAEMGVARFFIMRIRRTVANV